MCGAPWGRATVEIGIETNGRIGLGRAAPAVAAKRTTFFRENRISPFNDQGYMNG